MSRPMIAIAAALVFAAHGQAQHVPNIRSSFELRLDASQPDRRADDVFDSEARPENLTVGAFSFQQSPVPVGLSGRDSRSLRPVGLDARYRWALDVDVSSANFEFPVALDIFGLDLGTPDGEDRLDDGYNPGLLRLMIVPVPLAASLGLAAMLAAGLSIRPRRSGVR